MPVTCSDMKRLLLRGIVFAMLCLAVSCQSRAPEAPVLTARQWQDRLQEDRDALEQLRVHNLHLRSDFLSLQSEGGWRDRGYFTAQESDRLEGLLFRYHVIHGRLLQIAERYAHTVKTPKAGTGADGGGMSDAERVHSMAHRQLLAQAQFAVETFSGDSLAIDRLNQRYPRSEIPARTYDHLVDLLKTTVDRKVESLGRQMEDDFSKSSYTVRAKLFYRVSRFKNPRAYLIHFSDEKKEEVIQQLEPGDLVMSYTSGYVSSFFIPGQFKHAMIYVGTVEDRRKIGLVGSRVSVPGVASNEKKVRADFIQGKTLEGREADMIEAVAEGVKFSDLRHVMDTHINRLLVIRPKLSRQERVEYLTRVFSYLGQEYDFEFDFADAGRQVCTEVVYRSLNGFGGIDYQLSKHAGRLVMTADDMVNYWLNDRPEAFEFVLYADESKLVPGHAARIWTGASGRHRLEKLMDQ